MANKKSGEYVVVMRLRETPPDLRVDVVAQTHLLAVRLAMQIHPAYVPTRVEGGAEAHNIRGFCCVCNCVILEGDRFADRFETVTDVNRDTGATTRRREKRGIECCECRPGARMLNWRGARL